jgi:acyl-CoA thioester hydrolase
MRMSAHHRSEYVHFHPITTRWMDNDAYGHVNNILYYSWFDTIVNALLIQHGALDVERSPVIALVIETGCHYFAPIAFPQRVTAGLRVASLGNSSIRYEIGIFREDDPIASAQGFLVHVSVDRATRRPVEIPDAMRKLLTPLIFSSTSLLASTP